MKVAIQLHQVRHVFFQTGAQVVRGGRMGKSNGCASRSDQCWTQVGHNGDKPPQLGTHGTRSRGKNFHWPDIRTSEC